MITQGCESLCLMDQQGILTNYIITLQTLIFHEERENLT